MFGKARDGTLLAMHQGHRGPSLKVRVPVFQTILVSMGGKAANRVYPCCNTDLFAPQADVLCTVHQGAFQCVLRLKAGR